MDRQLRQVLTRESQRIGVVANDTFYTKLDAYVAKHFPEHSNNEKNVIQAYLGDAGLRIARAEGKGIAEAEDAKAAVYFYHLPDDPDDPCIAAGEAVLTKERMGMPGVLSHGIREFLNAAKQHG